MHTTHFYSNSTKISCTFKRINQNNAGWKKLKEEEKIIRTQKPTFIKKYNQKNSEPLHIPQYSRINDYGNWIATMMRLINGCIILHRIYTINSNIKFI